MIILQAFLDRPSYVFVFICSLEAKWYDRWREVSSGKPWIISSISTEVSATEPDESSQLPSQCNRLGALIQRWNFLAQRGAHQTLPPYIHSFLLLVWDWLLNAATRGKADSILAPVADWLTSCCQIMRRWSFRQVVWHTGRAFWIKFSNAHQYRCAQVQPIRLQRGIFYHYSDTERAMAMWREWPSQRLTLSLGDGHPAGHYRKERIPLSPLLSFSLLSLNTNLLLPPKMT